MRQLCFTLMLVTTIGFTGGAWCADNEKKTSSPDAAVTEASETESEDSAERINRAARCEKLRTQVIQGDSWDLQPKEYREQSIDIHGVGKQATKLAGCRAIRSGSDDHYHTGFPVNDSVCLPMVFASNLIAANARGNDCAVLAQAYGDRAGTPNRIWQALCAGMAGDADACERLRSDDNKRSFAVECNAIRLDDPGICNQCEQNSTCSRNCRAVIGMHRAIRSGETPTNVGEPASSFSISVSAMMDPEYDCDAWFENDFERLCGE